MTARIQLPAALREHVAGAAELDVTASDVAGALAELASRHPALRRHLFDDAGTLRGYVRIYLNEDDLRDLAMGAATRVGPGDVIMIVPSIAGGDDTGTAFSRAEVERYARHIVLGEVGWEGQQRLRSACVAIVGAGGLGSPVGLYLAAAGIGTLGIIDFDTVETSNLQRQVLYGTRDVGRPKTAAAAERLSDVNPHVNIMEHRERLTSANALDVLRDYDVVVDGTDNFATRYLTNDACVLLGKPYVYGSILRFEGQIAVFDARTGPCYRCLFQEPPPPGLVPSCAQGGVLGVLPGIIGSLQALEAIKLILGRGDTLAGRIALFDALAFRWRELRLRKNVDCPACGDEPTITALIDYEEFCGSKGSSMHSPQQGHAVPQITAAELKQRLDAGERILLIDVREPFEWEGCNLAEHGAIHIPLDEVLEREDEIERDVDVVLYCRSGARSAGAIRQLRARGFDRLANLQGGLLAWAEEIDPDMPVY